jgi:anti-sigma B factor antagonist
MQPPVSCESVAGGTLVRVTCRLDAEGQEQLVQEIDRLLRSGEHVVQLDLAAVAFISSAGIGAILAASKKLKAAGGGLVVVAASPQVSRVFQLTKLDTLVGLNAAAVAAASAADGTTSEATIGDVRLVALTRPPPRETAATVVAFGGAPAVFDLASASFALGLGTPDADAASPLVHAGELVVAAGCLFHRPPAADPRIDWVVPQPGLAARLALVGGIAWEGVPAGSAGFEPANADSTVSLDALARALVAAAGGKPVAFVAVGEIHGLVGVELVRPLAEATAVDHPRTGAADVAARWLSFSREPVHARQTALVVGVAAPASRADPALAGVLRPLDPAGDATLLGHVHAAVFTFRPVRRDPGNLARLVASLAEAPPLAVMHLLADPAPLVGHGRSDFIRGVVWFGPLAAGGGGAA